LTSIAHVSISLVSAPGIEIDNRELIIRAVELARDRNVDFARQACSHGFCKECEANQANNERKQPYNLLLP